MSLSTLRDEIAGQLLEPGDDGFEDARRVWNGMIDRHPLAVVRAAGVGDIAPTIRAARALGVPLAIRGGGHNVAGNGTVEGGLVLDLGALTDVTVDPSRGRSGSRPARPWRTWIGRPSPTVWPFRWAWCPGPAWPA